VPKKRRSAKIPTPAWERPRGALGSRILGRGLQFYGAVAVGALLVMGLGIIGYAFWNDYWEERNRPGSTAIQVEDTRYRLDYYSRRLAIYLDQVSAQNPEAAQPTSALPAVSDLLIQEEIVRRFAAEMEVTATDDEIREEIASRLGIPADDESFDVVLQQELAGTELSETDHRRMIEAAVLTDKLEQKFLSEVPESAESVHYRQIVVSEQATADDIKRQIEAGGDFAALAAENSLDPATKDNGGDVGWVPRGVLGPSTEELLFVMAPGEIQIRTDLTPAGVAVIEMLDKDGDRPVEEAQTEPLAARLFADWVEEKRQSLSIVNNMDVRGNYDQGKVEWVVERAYQS
jgi:parvulin-like peptidyl-prolyl isomerase